MDQPQGPWPGWMPDDPLNALLALDTYLHHDPVDIFEDLLTARLGLSRHPELSRDRWRRLRVAFIEAADELVERGSGSTSHRPDCVLP